MKAGQAQSNTNISTPHIPRLSGEYVRVASILWSDIMRCEYNIVFDCDELEGDLWLKKVSSIPFVPLDGSQIQLEVGGVQYYYSKVHYTEWYDEEQCLHICVNMDDRNLNLEAYKRLIKDEIQECSWQICQCNTSYTTLDLIAEIRSNLHKEEVSQR